MGMDACYHLPSTHCATIPVLDLHGLWLYDGLNLLFVSSYFFNLFYFRLIIGFAVTYFILIFFNEAWLLSTIVYSPCLIFYMQKTGRDLLGSEQTELVLRCSFCILIYALTAYKIEILTKQSFMGRESSEKAFHRWMKVFETFPEGICLVRNNYILYSNRSLKYILNAGINRTTDEDPLYEHLRNDLRISCVH